MIVNPVRVNNIYRNNCNAHKSENLYPQFCAKGVYPGSFDSITNRHLDIIKPINPETAVISSNIVRNIHKIRGNVSNFVPECVERTLYLKKSFDDIVKNLNFDPKKSVEVFDKIINAYDNPARGYHDDKHIFSMLKNLDEFILNNPNLVQNPNEFKFAILMHDYVNGTHNEVTNNERKRILQSFLDKENIYNIDFFKTKYEVQARKNIHNELKTLK